MIPKNIQEVYARADRLFSKSEVEAALDRMAIEIKAKVADKNPVFICVVLGGIVTLGNLLPRMDFPLQIDYIHLTRYNGKCVGKEEIAWKATPSHELKDRTVVVVDDVLDEGLTLAAVNDYCHKQGAKEVLNVVLVDKKKPRKPGGLKDADIFGLSVGDRYIFGYGLDYKEYLRNAPGIFAAAKEHCV